MAHAIANWSNGKLTRYSYRMSVAVNFTVYCNKTKKTLLPWRISGVHQPSHTFKTFFEGEVREKLQSSVVLEETFVGRSKEKLDVVTLDLLICDVVSVFNF